MVQPETARWRDILTGKYRSLLTLVCLGVWLHAADSLLVATMIPDIVADIGGANLIPWTVMLYQIGSVVAGVASGLLAMRFGLRRPMCAAAVLFAIGCIFSAIAPAMWVLLVGRLLQGLGGGGLMALSFVSVSILFPKRLVARALGAMSALWGISAFLGPLAGGLFVEYATWEWGFWFFAIQALFLALWVFFKVDDTAKPHTVPASKHFPVARLLLLTAGVLAIAYAGVEVSTPRTPLFLVIGIGLLVVFLVLDARRDASRMLPRGAVSFTSPVGAGLTMLLCMAAATVAIGVYGPLFMTILHGSSPIVAGYIVACGSLGWSGIAIVVSGIPERYDRKLITTGMLIVALSTVGFGFSVASGPLWLIALFSTLDGIGFGMAFTFILGRLNALSPASEIERVSGAIPTLQRLGFALGAAFVGIIANASGISDVANTEVIRFAALAVFFGSVPLAALGLIALWSFVRARSRGGF